MVRKDHAMQSFFLQNLNSHLLFLNQHKTQIQFSFFVSIITTVSSFRSSVRLPRQYPLYYWLQPFDDNLRVQCQYISWWPWQHTRQSRFRSLCIRVNLGNSSFLWFRLSMFSEASKSFNFLVQEQKVLRRPLPGFSFQPL